jgi:parvulin-like peptidyl-prolyl isomerase
MYKGLLIVALLLAGLLPAHARAEDLARVGSDTISREEFEAKARLEEAGLKRALTKDERVALLHSLVNQRLLVAEARRRKLDRSPEHKAFMAEAERKALADSIYDSEVSAKSQVSEAEAHQFYDQNPGVFDQAQVSQVLIAVQPGQEEAAQKRAEALKRSLLKAPKTFASVARSQSDDPLSKPHGGDLGTLRRGMLAPELEKAVFDSKAAGIIGPVKTQFGYHILQVKGMKHLSWEESGPALQQDMQRARAAQLQKALLDDLKKKERVEMSEDKL